MKGSRAGRRAFAKRPGAFHHGDLRRAMLEAARHLLEREGPLGVGLRAAARLAGVSQTAPYRHFPDKDSILAALAEEGLGELRERMAEAAASARSPAEALPAIAEAYVGFATSQPHLFRLVFGPELADRKRWPAVREAGLRAKQVVVDALAAAQRAGAVRAGDPEELSLGHWAAVHGLASLAVDGLLDERIEACGGIGPLVRLVTVQLQKGSAPR